MSAASLAQFLVEFAEGRRPWRLLQNHFGPVLAGWSRPPDPAEMADWVLALEAASEAGDRIAREIAVLGVPADPVRLHRNLCGLLAIRCATLAPAADWFEQANRLVGRDTAVHWFDCANGCCHVDRQVKVPAAVRFHAGQGAIADFVIARLPAGQNLVEEPDVALCAAGPSLLKTLRNSALPGGFAWSVSLREADVREAPLDGNSCGGALRVAFRALLANAPYDPECLILADREFQAVEGEVAKIEAVLRSRKFNRVLLGAGSAIGPDQRQRFSEAIRLVDIAGEDHAFAQALQQIDVSGQPCRTTDPLYIEPKALTEIIRLLRSRRGETIIVRGPSRSGKTSLLHRISDWATADGFRLISIDLAKLESKALATADAFFLDFTSEVLERGGLSRLDPNEWNSLRSNSQNATWFIENRLLETGKPLVLAIDQADRMAESRWRDDFYRTIRTWHNDRSAPGSIGAKWGSCSLLLLISADPNRFIQQGAEGSPFNVGRTFPLSPLGLLEIRSLLATAGLPMGIAEAVSKNTGGWPYLVRLSAAYLRAQPAPGMEIRSDADISGEGLFADWLESLWNHVHRQRPESEAYLHRMVEGKRNCHSHEEELTRFHLIRRGILLDQIQDTYSCDLYRRFFGVRLKEQGISRRGAGIWRFFNGIFQ